MISLLLNHLFSNKNKLIVTIYFFLILLIYILLLPLDITKDELYFNRFYYKESYNNLIYEIFKLLTPIITLIIVGDHDHKYINNITTYKGRSYVIFNKLLIYSYILFLNIMYISISYYLILKMFNLELLINNKFYIYSFSLYLDSLLLMILLIVFVREDNKYISFIILIIYVIINFIYNINRYIVLFYIIPFYPYVYYNYTYSFIYQLLYLLLLTILTTKIYLNKDFK